MKRGTSESRRISEAQQRFDSGIVRGLQRFARETTDYWARCKRAAVLWDWIHGVSVDDLERQYSTTPFQGRMSYGDIRRIADATRFHLRSAQQVIAVLVTDDVSILSAIDELLESLESGIPRESLGLLELPVALNRGQYLALHMQGVRNVDDVWRIEPNHLKTILGEGTAQTLGKKRPAGRTQN